MCALIISSNISNEQKLSSGDLCCCVFLLPMLLLMPSLFDEQQKVSYQANKLKQRQYNTTEYIFMCMYI